MPSPQSLLARAAYSGSAALFRLALFLPQTNTNDASVILNALDGGVSIWEILLEKDKSLKNARLGHHGTVVELCVRHDKPEVLRYLIENGAEIDGEGMDLGRLAEISRVSRSTKKILEESGVEVKHEENGSKEEMEKLN
ncbi:MAG: hypothetical protein Q9190_008008, partial [Brigantiaea leucoxantha]